MKNVADFSFIDRAMELRNFLRDNGVRSRVVVDPLSSRCPSHSDIHGVTIQVAEADLAKVESLLNRRPEMRRAS